MSLSNEDLTWRFELRLRYPDRWVPITTDMVDEHDEHDEYAEHVGTKEMPEIWRDADEAAPDELHRVLADLIEVGEPLGMTGARIAVWEGIGTDGDPAVVLEATADQLAVGELELANRQVQDALREVERARARVRARIIKTASENRLGRNMIARAVSGALSRRLVLQFLTSYDLVEAIREALQSRWGSRSTYQRWYDDWNNGLRESDELYLGPFRFGPVRLDLEPNGHVYLHLVKADGPVDDWIDPDDNEAREAADRAYMQARIEHAQKYAAEVLPLLTKAGFRLLHPDDTPASVEDLAQTINDTRNRLLVSEDA